jgi:acetyl/propionyl-CoA carboxylase alpha subunit
VLKRVLIANRGEIAIRIARAADALGIESVSVHAPADALGLHTRVTTETRVIGASAGDPIKAYLDIEALIEVARESGCDCVHPGYGFLSENADFAEAVIGSGLVWVGPPPAAIRAMGL